MRGSGTLADFVVDYGLLQQTHQALTTLTSEFSNIDAVPKAANWGHSGISAAMGSFAGNWSDHRSRLVHSMEAMTRNVHQTVTETQQFDSAYQHQLTR